MYYVFGEPGGAYSSDGSGNALVCVIFLEVIGYSDSVNIDETNYICRMFDSTLKKIISK